MAERIRVSAPGGEDYKIVIEADLLADGNRLAGEFGLNKRVAVITNETIAPLHGEKLVAALPDAVLVTMQDGEAYKTMETVTQLCRDLAKAGLDRGSTVIALGGGVVGDTAGFVAASYMRGIRLVQAPTSLLAIVDSSVGGKVGVDIPEGKNLVGAFKQPAAVLIDPNTLATLPDMEWRNGLAETIKHGLIADAGILDKVREMSIPEPDTDKMVALLKQAIQVKVNVVEEDPYEQGIRQFLNLGHTFAHAIERVTEYKMPHGMAVGIGLQAAAELSAKVGVSDNDLPGKVLALICDHLYTRVPNVPDFSVYWDAMRTDKKWRDGRSRFVLLKDIEQPTIVEDVERDVVIEVLESLRYD
ncbi:MAG: 3-dehydroquinate synthase [Chloroflexota bacterium]